MINDIFKDIIIVYYEVKYCLLCRPVRFFSVGSQCTAVHCRHVDGTAAGASTGPNKIGYLALVRKVYKYLLD